MTVESFLFELNDKSTECCFLTHPISAQSSSLTSSGHQLVTAPTPAQSVIRLVADRPLHVPWKSPTSLVEVHVHVSLPAVWRGCIGSQSGTWNQCHTQRRLFAAVTAVGISTVERTNLSARHVYSETRTEVVAGSTVVDRVVFYWSPTFAKYIRS